MNTASKRTTRTTQQQKPWYQEERRGFASSQGMFRFLFLFVIVPPVLDSDSLVHYPFFLEKKNRSFIATKYSINWFEQLALNFS
jgi:hypothetical protein